MLKVWVKVVKNNKIIKDKVVSSNIEGGYQANLKACITTFCEEFDIEKPYWLPYNVDEFNKRSKVTFDCNNFIESIDFDKLVIEELEYTEL
ncbi:MAG TPA: hypothetical protein DGK91_01390 [Clostridium sp.]|jgi:hypothetical protein|nr:hypothetical protein [Clostridia bacterium]HCW03294.1 hypothetical protein [Clostridium sp.]